MITEFSFLGLDKSISCYSFDFPIDLRVGDEVWIEDFKDFLFKGQYYCLEKNISSERFDPVILNSPQVKVCNEISYGYKNGTVVKMLTLKLL